MFYFSYQEITCTEPLWTNLLAKCTKAKGLIMINKAITP